MNVTKELLGQIQSVFSKHDYDKAIPLCKGVPEAFFIIAFKRLQRRKITPPFWDVILSKPADHLLRHEAALPLMVKFWSTRWSLGQLERFAMASPKLFIKSSRISGLFLQEGFLEMLSSLSDGDDYIRWHFEKMKGLREQRKVLKSKVAELTKQVQLLPLAEFLSELVIWWEENRSELMGTQNTLFNLLQRILKGYFTADLKRTIDHEDTYKVFLEVVIAYHKEGKLNILPVMAALWEEYAFETATLEEYQYEVRHDFNKLGEFRFDKRAQVKFRRDGEKLQAFQAFWHHRAVFMVAMKIDKELINVNLEEGYDANSYVSQEKINLLLDYVNGFENLSEVDLRVPTFFSSLQVHALSRYRSKMDEAMAKGLSPVKALMQVMVINEGHGFPIQVNAVEVFKRMVHKTYKGKLDMPLIDQLIPRGLTAPEDFSIMEKPLLLIDKEKTINLLNITSESNFFLRSYFNIVRSMDQQRDQQGDRLFEKEIGETLRRAGFNCEYSVDYEINKGLADQSIKGDIDVIVSEKQVALLLEVKRVKLRFDSAGIWNEFEKVNWGGLQLQKTKTAMQEGVVDLKIQLPEDIGNMTGMIVTPWFEHDHQEINGFVKVSWFEIRYALEQMNGEWSDRKNRLKALIDLIVNDRVWPHVFGAAKEYEDTLKDLYRQQMNG
jgi:hypothetical protein